MKANCRIAQKLKRYKKRIGLSYVYGDEGYFKTWKLKFYEKYLKKKVPKILKEIVDKER